MHEFWYNYVKPKFGIKGKLYYMDTYSSIVYMKIDDIYRDFATKCNLFVLLQVNEISLTSNKFY